MAGPAHARVHPGGAGGLAALLLALAGCVATPDGSPAAGTEPLAAGERIVMPPALPGRVFASVPVVTVMAVTPRPAEASTGMAPQTVPAPMPEPPAAAAAAPVAAPEPSPPAAAPADPPPTAALAEQPPETPARTAPPAPPATARGAVRVQLVAAGSEAEALQHWARFAARETDLAEGRAPVVQRLDRDGQAPVFRLRVGGFAGAEDAARWCARLRERQIACWVAG